MPQDYVQYAGVVLALASLLISGLAPRFAEFTIPHDDFGRRARLVASLCRGARHDFLLRGIREAVEDPGVAQSTGGALAAYARVEYVALSLEFRTQRLMDGERVARLIIVVDVVLAILLAAASLLLAQFWFAWTALAVVVLLAMIGSYIRIYQLCGDLEASEEAARELTANQD